METRLFSMGVSKPRDLLRSRQRTRQVAGLLGFAPEQQATLAAAVFAWLRQHHRPGRRSSVAFIVADSCLRIKLAEHVFTTALPLSLAHAVEDVAWMMRELDRQAPFRVMDELDAQNRELLAAARPARPVADTGRLRISDPAA